MESEATRTATDRDRGEAVFIIGSRGIPASYGGFETFAQEIGTRLARRGFEVHVSCELVDGADPGAPEHDGVKLFYVEAPRGIGATVVSDVRALKACHGMCAPGDVVYLLGYGAGPFAVPMVRRLRSEGVRVWINPDGLEWKRSRWAGPVRRYLRFAEWALVRSVDRVVCDSTAIRDHHVENNRVAPARAVTIPYGAPVLEDLPAADVEWRDTLLTGLGHRDPYYLYVGRMVPENNLDLIARAVCDDAVRHPLIVVAPYSEGDRFYRRVASALPGGWERKVSFVGGVYDSGKLQALRKGAFAHLHGHEVGGTNPSLLEAMGAGRPVLALETDFNREALREAGLYFDKRVDSLVEGLRAIESMGEAERSELGRRARGIVERDYAWDGIAGRYGALIGGTSPVER